MTILTHDLHQAGHLEKAQYALEIGRNDLAIELIEKALLFDPQNGYGFFLLTRAYDQKGDDRKALTWIYEALRLEPDAGIYHAYLGKLLSSLGKNSEADQAFQTALSFEPYHPTIYNWYGASLLERYPKLALEYISKALELEPEEHTNYLLMGLAFEKMNDHSKAEASLQEALHLHPENVQVYKVLGSYYLRRAQVKKAFPLLKEAIRLNPEDSDTREAFQVALKSKSWFYRNLFSYSLFLNKIGNWRWIFVIMLYIVFPVTFLLVQYYPAYQTPIYIFLGVYIIFFLSMWLVEPLFNWLIKRGYMK